MLLHLADSLPAARVLLLVPYRPGYQNPFGERTYTTRVGLRTLSDHDEPPARGRHAGDIGVTHELRRPDRPQGGSEPLLPGGGPHVAPGGRRPHPGGRPVPTPETLAEMDVPDTIQDVIMARIDRLEEAPRRALQLAAVIGREFTVRLLARIGPGDCPSNAPSTH